MPAAADAINSGIPSVNTLASWAPMFQGYMYNGMGTTAIAEPEVWLAWYLNTMIMVAGGSDSLLSSAPSSSPTQGCVLQATIVPDWLIVLLFVTILACVLLSLLALALAVRLHYHRDRRLGANAPVDVWTWIAQAISEADSNKCTLLPSQFGCYVLRLQSAAADGEGGQHQNVVVIRRRANAGASLPLRTRHTDSIQFAPPASWQTEEQEGEIPLVEPPVFGSESSISRRLLQSRYTYSH